MDGSGVNYVGTYADPVKCRIYREVTGVAVLMATKVVVKEKYFKTRRATRPRQHAAGAQRTGVCIMIISSNLELSVSLQSLRRC